MTPFQGLLYDDLALQRRVWNGKLLGVFSQLWQWVDLRLAPIHLSFKVSLELSWKLLRGVPGTWFSVHLSVQVPLGHGQWVIQWCSSAGRVWRGLLCPHSQAGFWGLALGTVLGVGDGQQAKATQCVISAVFFHSQTCRDGAFGRVSSGRRRMSALTLRPVPVSILV